MSSDHLVFSDIIPSQPSPELLYLLSCGCDQPSSDIDRFLDMLDRHESDIDIDFMIDSDLLSKGDWVIKPCKLSDWLRTPKRVDFSERATPTLDSATTATYLIDWMIPHHSSLHSIGIIVLMNPCLSSDRIDQGCDIDIVDPFLDSDMIDMSDRLRHHTDTYQQASRLTATDSTHWNQDNIILLKWETIPFSFSIDHLDRGYDLDASGDRCDLNHDLDPIDRLATDLASSETAGLPILHTKVAGCPYPIIATVGATPALRLTGSTLATVLGELAILLDMGIATRPTTSESLCLRRLGATLLATLFLRGHTINKL